MTVVQIDLANELKFFHHYDPLEMWKTNNIFIRNPLNPFIVLMKGQSARSYTLIRTLNFQE